MDLGGIMLFTEALASADDYVNALNREIIKKSPDKALSRIARKFLAFTITGIIVTGTISWKKMERASAGAWSTKAMSWFLHHSTSIVWKILLVHSLRYIFRIYGVKSGVFVIDDYDRHRSKNTTMIHGVHKVKNKKGGGFVSSQNVVKAVLVTGSLTLPVGFGVHQPDPDVKAWRKNNEALKKKKIPKRERPPELPKNPDYPSKKEIAMKLLRQFRHHFGDIEIKAFVADNAFLSKQLRDDFRRVYPKSQMISQLRYNQGITTPSRKKHRLNEYFEGIANIKKPIELRCGTVKVITYKSSRLWVNAHKRWYHVVAMRYEGEEDFRYLCATDVTWRAEDIIRAYAYRWIVEVVIEDSKLYAGYGQVAMQQGEEGTCRAIILSQLLDHFLISHPLQSGLHRAGKPLWTVGSMKRKLQLEALKLSIEKVLDSPDPKEALREWMQNVEDLIDLRPSKKHMMGQDFDFMSPSPSLSKRFGKVS